MCQKCDLRFTVKDEMKLHLLRNECRMVTRCCCLCSEYNARACDLRRHLKDVHERIYSRDLPPPTTVEELKRVSTAADPRRRRRRGTEKMLRAVLSHTDDTEEMLSVVLPYTDHGVNSTIDEDREFSCYELAHPDVFEKCNINVECQSSLNIGRRSDVESDSGPEGYEYDAAARSWNQGRGEATGGVSDASDESESEWPEDDQELARDYKAPSVLCVTDTEAEPESKDDKKPVGSRSWMAKALQIARKEPNE